MSIRGGLSIVVSMSVCRLLVLAGSLGALYFFTGKQDAAQLAVLHAKPAPKPLTSDDILWTVMRATQKMLARTEVGWTPEQAGIGAYQIMFGGEKFSSFARHPDRVICKEVRGERICSAAAGGYQIMPQTMEGLLAKHSDWYEGDIYSPQNQDLAMRRLLEETGSWAMIESGITVVNQQISVDEAKLRQALKLSAKTWCGLPTDADTEAERGECKGQPQKEMSQTVAWFYEDLASEQGLKP